MRSDREELDRMLIPNRTRAGLVFQANIAQLLFFNDEIKDKDKTYREPLEAAVANIPMPCKDRNLLIWLAESLDFERLRLTLSVVHLVTVFEAYLLDTVREILTACPQALKTGRQLTYEEIFSCKDMKSLRALAIEREVEKLGYKSYQNLAKYFAERFNIDFCKLEYIGQTCLEEEDIQVLIRDGLLIGDMTNNEPEGMLIDQNAVVEIFATRNILVHNQGIVNQSYLDAVPNSSLKIGTLKPLSGKYFRNALGILVVLADAIEDVTVKKYVQQSEEQGVNGQDSIAQWLAAMRPSPKR